MTAVARTPGTEPRNLPIGVQSVIAASPAIVFPFLLVSYDRTFWMALDSHAQPTRRNPGRYFRGEDMFRPGWPQ